MRQTIPSKAIRILASFIGESGRYPFHCIAVGHGRAFAGTGHRIVIVEWSPEHDDIGPAAGEETSKLYGEPSIVIDTEPLLTAAKVKNTRRVRVEIPDGEVCGRATSLVTQGKYHVIENDGATQPVTTNADTMPEVETMMREGLDDKRKCEQADNLPRSLNIQPQYLETIGRATRFLELPAGYGVEQTVRLIVSDGKSSVGFVAFDADVTMSGLVMPVVGESTRALPPERKAFEAPKAETADENS